MAEVAPPPEDPSNEMMMASGNNQPVDMNGEEMGPGDENVEEDPGEFPFLKADHVLMERVQKALHQQLAKQDERLTYKVREKQAELKALTVKREDLGVQLYSVQQQLAKLQLVLEEAHDRLATLANNRVAAERDLRILQDGYTDKKKESEVNLKRMIKAQDELNQLNVTLRQVEEYTEQMKAEIQVTRRATYKAESALQQTETVKSSQDVLLDKMAEQIRRLTDQKALHEAQLLAQKHETEAAIATLTDSNREIDSIEFEKTQLMQQWRGSLVGVQRRDDAVQAIQKAIGEQEEQEMTIDSETRGVQTSTKHEQERNEKLTGLLQRNKNEIQMLHSQMDSLKQESQRLGEQYDILKKSLDHASREKSRLDTAITSLEQQAASVSLAVQKVARLSTTMVEKIVDLLSQQTTLDRSASNTTKSAKRVFDHIKSQEAQLESLHNEIARVKVDALNTRAHNELLKSRLKQLTTELSERESLIDQYEMEIRKRHHAIEKKQLYVDRLNKEYDEKRSKQGDEHMGPLEAKIKNLRKRIAERTADYNAMQKAWIRKQTELITIKADTEAQGRAVEQRKDKILLLQQKKLRLEREATTRTEDVKRLRREIASLRFETDRLNPAIHQTGELAEKLRKEISVSEASLKERLKELEKMTEKIEVEIQKLKTDKEKLQEDTVEAERVIMLWERKIILEKEVQETLDPNVGQVIAKRDSIQIKYEPRGGGHGSSKGGKGGSGEALTKNALKRQLASLHQSLHHCNTAAQDADRSIREREMQLREVQDHVDLAVAETDNLEASSTDVQKTLMLQKALKYRNLAEVLKLQRAAKKFGDAAAAVQEGAPIGSNVHRVEHDLTRESGVAIQIREVVRTLQEAYPHLDSVLNVFGQWASSIQRDATETATLGLPPIDCVSTGVTGLPEGSGMATDTGVHANLGATLDTEEGVSPPSGGGTGPLAAVPEGDGGGATAEAEAEAGAESVAGGAVTEGDAETEGGAGGGEKEAESGNPPAAESPGPAETEGSAETAGEETARTENQGEGEDAEGVATAEGADATEEEAPATAGE
uniref:Coiled-coil domain-containing protein 40 n=1 Tax=Chromera velia CCMP2878 TaxID=1169474 RepID=A0A0G4FZX2_9ALVE|eukprot:Cvel_513.t1-p1 / transcript=Cvel_513.t1 / gene=Cvel_513 / organism=Chromera_velia_CCMP2878 / gene_product=Coiled-coil domain-containing protein 40, putative / transcript_product=Coiled-coil domain-containing protein 40, putative / location=Cvel_scaffold16:34934-43584(-) / protein_length=1052 / sequence_SO=supercontig / SO=protein_coding / is_pseudo=false